MKGTEILSTIFYFTGGLALFLFGMHQMSEGLQKSAGKKLKNLLDILTGNRYSGAFFGIAVTSVVQSSSAVTVMVVGFVNAGLIGLTQGLSVVLGANVGTTITAQLLAFKISALALPFITVGIVLIMFANKPKTKYIGEIFFGFGLLFFGMEMMKDAFAPMKNSPVITEYMIKYSSSLLIAALLGAIFTVLLQSSSAVIGITIAMAASGSITYTAACALVMGSNIGTTITANLAAISANKTAKQAAFGHFLFNFFGMYMLLFMGPLTGMVDSFTAGDPDFIAADGSKPNIARHVANFHTMFNIVNFIIFLPLLGIIANVSRKVIRTATEESYKTAQLSDSMLSTPAVAVSQCKTEVIKMGVLTESMLQKSKEAFINKDIELIREINSIENTIDSYKIELSMFLAKLIKKDLELYSAEVNCMLKTVSELEKIADHCDNVGKFTEIIITKELAVSEKAEIKLSELFDSALEFYSMMLSALEKPEKAAEIDRSLEDIIDAKQNNFKEKNIELLGEKESPVGTILAYIDIAHNLEKIGDHVDNVSILLQSQ